MSNTYFPIDFGVLVVLAALAAPANAVAQAAPTHIPERPAVATPGNTAEAEAILGAKLLVCNTCHGERGIPKNATVPIIWGQQESYLAKQLHDFQTGERNNEVMVWMATALTPAELGAAAASFAKKDWPTRVARAASASPPGGIVVCEACHQQNFVGGPIAPRLAGQSYEYLVEAMRRYAEGERTSSNAIVPMLQRNTEMVQIMQAISPADREAMARYISGL
jgi:cytochrome c553